MTGIVREIMYVSMKAWYPEPVTCGLCHKDTHDVYHVTYSAKYREYARDTWTNNVCPACLRGMEGSRDEDTIRTTPSIVLSSVR